MRRFDSLEGWHLLAVTDLRTPEDFRLKNGSVISPRDQEDAYPEISEVIGWNTVDRRNLGFLWAMEAGAEIVATVDDDNVPLVTWGAELMVGSEILATKYSGAEIYDPLAVTENHNLWHRGYPIQELANRNYRATPDSTIIPDVQANLWNGDPDIDAIARFQFPDAVEFSMNTKPFFLTGCHHSIPKTQS